MKKEVKINQLITLEIHLSCFFSFQNAANKIQSVRHANWHYTPVHFVTSICAQSPTFIF